MKLTKLKLKDYYQFKDLDIDLTYPLDMKKRANRWIKCVSWGRAVPVKQRC